MINVDISNIWGCVSLPDLLALEAEISRAHMALEPGFPAPPPAENSDELALILDAARRIRQMSDAVVVVGPCSAARGAIEALQGPYRNFGKSKGDPAIYFAGDSLSPRQIRDLSHQLEGRDYSLIVLPAPADALEAPLALRSLRWMLERKYGTLEARGRIFAVTAGSDTTLHTMAEAGEWEVFSLPEGVSAPYLALTAAGLLPMAAAGLDVRALVQGAEKAMEEMNLRSFENPVWLYSAVRCLMKKTGKTTEFLAGWASGIEELGRWWQQLFAQGDSHGLFPTAAAYPAPGLDANLAHSGSHLLETILRFAPSENAPAIAPDALDADGLNYLAGKTLNDVAQESFDALVESHTDFGVSIVTADCDALSEQTLGELFHFLQLSCAICDRVQVFSESTDT